MPLNLTKHGTVQQFEEKSKKASKKKYHLILEILMGCGSKLITPKLSEGQELDGSLILKVEGVIRKTLKTTTLVPSVRSPPPVASLAQDITLCCAIMASIEDQIIPPVVEIPIKFSDDKGKYEEAIDLGGPRREFLQLLLVALMQSSMFEGKEDSLNLALDSQAIREDRYFIAGRAVAVSLVHGGPAPGCFSKTLFDSLVQGPDMCIPVLDDIADCKLYNKIKKVSEATALEELQHSTEPIMDYLANAGCLWPLRSIADRDRLVEDLLMFQVVNRVRGPFERFRDGLKTLGVLAKVQQHPEAFRSVFCHQPNQLTADIMDDLFEMQWSENGSNKRANENRVIAFWRDYLQDVEEEGSQRLLQVPPIGFHPQPSIAFHHDTETPQRFPVANTCINCLRLPLYSTYGAFKSNIEFAINNTQGFGKE